MKPCDETRNQEYLLGTLPPGEAAQLEEHLAHCSSCARRVEEYRSLFRALAEIPMPPVPEGLDEAVIARVRPGSRAARLWWQWAPQVGRPLLGALASGVAAVCLAIFHEPLLLFFGKLTSGMVTGGTGEFIARLHQSLNDLSTLTVVIHAVVGVLLKLGPVIRALGDAVRTLPGQTSVLSIALSVATALFLGRAVGHLGREKLGHG